MFDFLKKKLAGLLNKTPEKQPAKKKAKKAKKTAKSVITKATKSRTKAEQQSDSEVETLITLQTTAPEQQEEKKEGFFAKLVRKMTSAPLKETDFEEAFEELEHTLLESNTALEAIDAFKTQLKQELLNQHTTAKEASAVITNALKSAILSLLQEPPVFLESVKKKQPFVILFFGINGTGKTTSIAKIAHYLKKNGISSVLAAADTFRAASIEQLETHATKLDIPIIKGQYSSDPAAVAFDAISYAKKHKINVVLIDTAGRMYTKTNLMKEMEKIIRVSKPDLKLFVGESITGNDTIDQARTFNETAGIDGSILTKADVDEKAGAILSIAHATNKPIYFLGTGQGYDDFIPFTKKSVLKNLGLE